MKMPMISVITVCYNAAADLQKTWRSVASQSFRDFEFIVVDGGSTDSTPDIIRSGEVVPDKFVSEPDGGIFDAMNKGARLAAGEWLIFMNAGDMFASPATLTEFSEILSDAEEDIIYGDALLDRGGEIVEKAGLEPANRHRMYFHHQAAFIRRVVQLDFPYRLDVGLCGDYCFFKETLIAEKRFRHVGKNVCIYDCTGISSRNRMKVIRGNVDVVRRFDKFFDRLRFLPRLWFVILWGRLFNKG